MTAQEDNHPQKEKLNYKSLLRIFLNIVKEFFIFALILYLILFILESFFPGFVSNNFSLNYILYVVIGLGIISAFAPEESEEDKSKEKPKVVDYFLAVFLGVIGGILIYYKIEIDPILRILTAVLAGVLIIGVSLTLLLVEDEEVKEREEEIETFVKTTFFSRKTFTTPIAFFRLLFFRKVNFPLFLILIVFLFTVLALPQKTGIAPRKINLGKLTSLFKSALAPEKAPTPSPTPLVEEEKLIKPSPKIMVKVLNGSREKDVAQNFVQLLRDSGFEKAFFGNAPNLNYENATIQFVPEDRDQVDLVANLLKESYSIINFSPPVATKSGEITVILGNKVKY